MKSKGFQWTQDTRKDAAGLASLEDWDEIASHARKIVEMSNNSAIPSFVEHSSTIWELVGIASIRNATDAIRLLRIQRLAQLWEMWENSNKIDFFFIKWPAWLISEAIQRKAERREHA